MDNKEMRMCSTVFLHSTILYHSVLYSTIYTIHCTMRKSLHAVKRERRPTASQRLAVPFESMCDVTSMCDFICQCVCGQLVDAGKR